MDPNAALAQIRALITEIRDLASCGKDPWHVLECQQIKAMELVDMIENLDCWLTDGGFYPADWAVKFR